MTHQSNDLVRDLDIAEYEMVSGGIEEITVTAQRLDSPSFVEFTDSSGGGNGSSGSSGNGGSFGGRGILGGGGGPNTPSSNPAPQRKPTPPPRPTQTSPMNNNSGSLTFQDRDGNQVTLNCPNGLSPRFTSTEGDFSLFGLSANIDIDQTRCV